ncbi:MAG: hypothetical protein ACKOPS_08590, partial [Cyanobium sp.]
PYQASKKLVEFRAKEIYAQRQVSGESGSAFDDWAKAQSDLARPSPPLPGKMTPLHPDHFNHQGA